jgi:hypothetical protein
LPWPPDAGCGGSRPGEDVDVKLARAAERREARIFASHRHTDKVLDLKNEAVLQAGKRRWRRTKTRTKTQEGCNRGVDVRLL